MDEGVGRGKGGIRTCNPVIYSPTHSIEYANVCPATNVNLLNLPWLTLFFFQTNVQLLQVIGYSPWSNVGLGALLKGTSAIDGGKVRVGFEPATIGPRLPPMYF